MSDARDLWAEHLKRGLWQLRFAKLLQGRGDVVEILDCSRLERLADFDLDYLSAD